MQSFNDSFRAKEGMRTSFFAGGVIGGALAWLLFTATLYGHSLTNVASDAASSAAAEVAPEAAFAPALPAAPGGLKATAVSNTRINLVWTDNSSAEQGFKIEVKIGASGVYTRIATVGANATTYASTGLEANTQYFYRVRAYNVDGHSGYSNEASATTLPNPPVAPSGLQGIPVSNTQIKLSWTDNSDNETGFKIERRLSSAIAYTLIATLGAGVTSYSSTGLSPNSTYSYRMYAYNASGNSAYSNVVSVRTLPNPPAAPSGLAATPMSNSQIDLSWKDNAGNELGFIIERKTLAGAYAIIDTLGANVTAYSNTGLSGNTQYFYQVHAYNAAAIRRIPMKSIPRRCPIHRPRQAT
jgi:phosphodiesterase/alkaline phosphatase D-like protein